MFLLVLLRHGESLWNKENRFTGWTDVDLSPQGIKEVEIAGEILRKEGYLFDVAFTSVLKRAIRTLWITMDKIDRIWLPYYCSWRLNERHYGALQGLNKSQTAEQYGEEQVLLWRRSYEVRPPALAKTDQRYPGFDPRYKDMDDKELPLAESLKDTVARFLPYWHQTITPAIKSGKKVLISAHGNSLRALVKYLDGISDEEIVKLNIPTGVPLVYELDKDVRRIKSYYLGDLKEVEKAVQATADQAKTQKH